MLPIAPTPRVAVLGAGITGLSAAWQLRRAGFRPIVFEKASRPGGAIGSSAGAVSVRMVSAPPLA